MNVTRRTALALLAGSAAALASIPAHEASASGATLFVRSAVENGYNTVTLPLYRGTSQGRTVWYIVLDASTSAAADKYGVNRASKLEVARGTAAVRKVTVRNGVIDFPASVDFAPTRVVVPGPGGFPPNAAAPGAIGEPGYSPLVELPDGTILNAPQVANATGRADKIVSIDTARGRVRYAETVGKSRGKAVRYVSTDASNPVAAALENVTWAPALDAAPFAGGDGAESARASLAAFVNGQTGARNPNRQGLNSALLDGLDPLNMLAWMPNQGRYSPLWDVHLAAWASGVTPTLQLAFDDVVDLAEHGKVTAPDGTAFGPSGFVVNCPIIARVD